MKDGRPSMLYDIRYFLEHSQSLPHAEAVAYGRRVAWLLNSEGVSFGTFSHAYICLSKSIAEAEVKVLDEAAEWWYRRIIVGTTDLPTSTSDAFQTVRAATIAALLMVSSDDEEHIRWADEIAGGYGENIHFLVRSKRYNKYDLNISTTITDDPANSHLIASLVERDTGREALLPPICFGMYLQSFDDAAAIGIRDVAITSAEAGDLVATWSDKFQQGRTNIVRGFDQTKPYYQSKLINRQT